MVGIVRADGTAVYGTSTEIDAVTPDPLSDGEYLCELQLDALALLPGSYRIRVHPTDPEGVRIFDTVERSFVIRGASREFGLVRLTHRWNHVSAGDPRR
jgi:lipopolysaccharide transport system ATP-binding protein